MNWKNWKDASSSIPRPLRKIVILIRRTDENGGIGGGERTLVIGIFIHGRVTVGELLLDKLKQARRTTNTHTGPALS